MEMQPNCPPEERVLTLTDLRALKEYLLQKYRYEPGSKEQRDVMYRMDVMFQANARMFVNLACRAMGEPEVPPLEYGMKVHYPKPSTGRSGAQIQLEWAADWLNAAMAYAKHVGEPFTMTFDPAREKPAQVELHRKPKQQEQAA